MARTTGGIIVTTNYENVTASPLDAKTVVPVIDDLRDIPNAYNGLTCFCKETSTMYMLIDVDNITNSGAAIGDGDAYCNGTVWKKVAEQGVAGDYVATDITYNPGDTGQYTGEAVTNVGEALDVFKDLVVSSTAAGTSYTPVGTGLPIGPSNVQGADDVKEALDALGENQNALQGDVGINAGNISTNTGDITTNANAIAAIGDGEDLFPKAGVAIKQIPAFGNTFGTSGTGTVAEWLTAAFFPFVQATFSNVTGTGVSAASAAVSTVAEWGDPINSYNIGSSFVMDAGDNCVSILAGYKLNSGSTWTTHNITGLDDSGSGDPLTFTEGHNFTGLTISDNVTFALNARFENQFDPAEGIFLDGMNGAGHLPGPTKSVVFNARSFAFKHAGVPTESQIMATTGQYSSIHSSFTSSAALIEYTYIVIPVRYDKYIDTILVDGSENFPGFRIVTALGGGVNDNLALTCQSGTTTTIPPTTSQYVSLGVRASAALPNIDYIIYRSELPITFAGDIEYSFQYLNGLP